MIGLFRTEVIRRCGPCHTAEEVEFAVLEWVAWFNRKRLHAPLGYVSPAEFESKYHRTKVTPAQGAGLA